MKLSYKHNPMIGLGMTTAMAAVMLSGCAGMPTQRAEVSAQGVESAAVAQGQTQAVLAAEAAVAAEPTNAAYRMRLGNAYLDAGRFASASTTFEDAMALGENSPRAALSLALALTGQARFAEASSLLSDWEGSIAASDLGLAMALAGQPERGIHILSNAIRGGDTTVKTRQNLAYAYAVAGRWRESRAMVAQDVPAHEVGQRMAEWSQMSAADAYQTRIAGLLGVPGGVRDMGQPAQLALANTVEGAQYAAAAPVAAYGTELAALGAPRVAVAATGSELPAVGAPAPVAMAPAPALPPVPAAAPAPAPRSSFADAFGTDRPVAPRVAAVSEKSSLIAPPPAAAAVPVAAAPVAAAPVAPQSASQVVVRSEPQAAPQAPALEPLPARAEAPAASASEPRAPRPTPRRAAPSVARGDDATHLIQLGSFASEAGARRAWGIYQDRHPELANREMVITQAVVNGRRYWRVSAAGYDQAGSREMCARVNSASGDGCISWAASSPLPGAVDTGVRLARR